MLEVPQERWLKQKAGSNLDSYRVKNCTHGAVFHIVGDQQARRASCLTRRSNSSNARARTYAVLNTARHLGSQFRVAGDLARSKASRQHAVSAACKQLCEVQLLAVGAPSALYIYTQGGGTRKPSAGPMFSSPLPVPLHSRVSRNAYHLHCEMYANPLPRLHLGVRQGFFMIDTESAGTWHADAVVVARSTSEQALVPRDSSQQPTPRR